MDDIHLNLSNLQDALLRKMGDEVGLIFHYGGASLSTSDCAYS